jgi:hypothetical protein
MHAPVSGFRIDEIALLQREPAEIVARHGARFVETADEEIGQSLLRLPLRLRLRLDVLMRNLRLRLRLRLRLLMQNLRLRLSLRLEVMMRLMDRLAHLLVRLRPLARRRRLDPAEFELHQPVYRIELGFEVFEPRVVLALQLLDKLVELRFLGVDLLSQESGPVLQVPANITHCCPSCMALVPTTESGLAGSRKTERTLPGRRARQVLQGPGLRRPGGLTALI